MKKTLLFALVMVFVLPFFSYEAVAGECKDKDLEACINEMCGGEERPDCEEIELKLFISKKNDFTEGKIVAISPPTQDLDKKRYTVELLDSLAGGLKDREKFYDFTSLGISKFNPTCVYWQEIPINNYTIKICRQWVP